MNRSSYISCCEDHGPAPCVIDVHEAAERNDAFRCALWTGCNLQLTLMSIPVRCDIGVEVHCDTDQYIRVEEGEGVVKFGACCERLDMQRGLTEGDAVFIPAGTWHNIINTGCCALKLSSVYAPPHHPRGTVHLTKEDAE